MLDQHFLNLEPQDKLHRLAADIATKKLTGIRMADQVVELRMAHDALIDTTHHLDDGLNEAAMHRVSAAIAYLNEYIFGNAKVIKHRALKTAALYQIQNGVYVDEDLHSMISDCCGYDDEQDHRTMDDDQQDTLVRRIQDMVDRQVKASLLEALDNVENLLEHEGWNVE